MIRSGIDGGRPADVPGASHGPATGSVARRVCAPDQDMVDVWCVVCMCMCCMCDVYSAGCVGVVIDVW